MPWRRFLERLHSDCADFGHTCNEEVLSDRKLIVMGAPHFFSQLRYLFCHMHRSLLLDTQASFDTIRIPRS